jgi:hypothetical protein
MVELYYDAFDRLEHNIPVELSFYLRFSLGFHELLKDVETMLHCLGFDVVHDCLVGEYVCCICHHCIG